MARVAAELGFTTMSLYRHVASKDELLQLMWNASATGAETLVLQGDGWREKLRMWAVIQRDGLDQHPWLTQMPMAAPPLAPNSMHFVERGLAAFDGTGLPDADRMRVIGLISSYTLSEARMAHDAARAAAKAMEAGQQPDPALTFSYEALLREPLTSRRSPTCTGWPGPPGRTRWSSKTSGRSSWPALTSFWTAYRPLSTGGGTPARRAERAERARAG